MLFNCNVKNIVCLVFEFYWWYGYLYLWGFVLGIELFVYGECVFKKVEGFGLGVGCIV